MNVETINEIIENNPKLASTREKLSKIQPNRYCIHQSWGFGLIKEYHEAENRLVINFTNKKEHSMDPAFCINTMLILPDNHILVRQQTEPKIIEETITKKPVEIVIQALQTYPNHAATGQELENLFHNILNESRFRRW
jgi:transcription elongation factor GreA-like protein